jgi:hypothetical protein
MVAVPLRVPPPQADTPILQWIVDALMHLDECIDETRHEQRAAAEERKEQIADVRATLSAYMTAAHAASTDLDARIESHIDEHRKIDDRLKGRHDVLKLQGRVVEWTLKAAMEGVKLGVLGAILKLTGVI